MNEDQLKEKLFRVDESIENLGKSIKHQNNLYVELREAITPAKISADVMSLFREYSSLRSEFDATVKDFKYKVNELEQKFLNKDYISISVSDLKQAYQDKGIQLQEIAEHFKKTNGLMSQFFSGLTKNNDFNFKKQVKEYIETYKHP